MESKKKLITQLKHKYRLVIMNDSTFEEKVSITLTKLNLFIVLSSLFVLFAGFGIFLMVGTPLRAYVPQKMNHEQNKVILDLTLKLDSMEDQLRQNEWMMNNSLRILQGLDDTTNYEQVLVDSTIGLIELSPSEHELSLRQELKPLLDLNADGKRRGQSIFAPFFPPVKGFVTDKFNAKNEHFATDIAVKSDPTVKAALKGTVILASWTPETGNIIALQHEDNLTTIYKHNAVILKKVGNFVDAGEAIAMVGNSGELSSGSHLHFEIWHNGMALNPEDFIVFK